MHQRRDPPSRPQQLRLEGSNALVAIHPSPTLALAVLIGTLTLLPDIPDAVPRRPAAGRSGRPRRRSRSSA
jgi:hypothetical protein